MNYFRLSRKLGLSIGYDVCDYGLVIPHCGTIVVGNINRIGPYAVLHTSLTLSIQALSLIHILNRIAAIYGHHGNGKTRILNFVCELIRENEGESLSYFARFNE